MADEEHVLVVERSVLEDAGLSQGLMFDVTPLLDAIFRPGVPRFMPRSRAETDPTWKQLIPYVIMTCDSRVLTYVRGRRAGESRLVGQRSMGIGGHINPGDDLPLFNSDFRDAYAAAVRREVDEEVSVEAGHSDQVVALLNDDSTEVGRVHVGIVHLWRLATCAVGKREQVITQMTFMTPTEMRAVRDSFETWSQFCLDGLAALRAEPQPPAVDGAKRGQW